MRSPMYTPHKFKTSVRMRVQRPPSRGCTRQLQLTTRGCQYKYNHTICEISHFFALAKSRTLSFRNRKRFEPKRSVLRENSYVLERIQAGHSPCSLLNWDEFYDSRLLEIAKLSQAIISFPAWHIRFFFLATENIYRPFTTVPRKLGRIIA